MFDHLRELAKERKMLRKVFKAKMREFESVGKRNVLWSPWLEVALLDREDNEEKSGYQTPFPFLWKRKPWEDPTSKEQTAIPSVLLG